MAQETATEWVELQETRNLQVQSQEALLHEYVENPQGPRTLVLPASMDGTT